MADGVVGELQGESRDLVRIARDNSDRLVRLIGEILDSGLNAITVPL